MDLFTYGLLNKKIKNASLDITQKLNGTRIESLDSTVLAVCGCFIDVIGIPVYVDDGTDYPQYDLQNTGWYVFARITAPDGITVTAGTSVTGAEGYIATIGTTYIDVAVKFDVAAMAQVVLIDWGSVEDRFVFSATNLAVRNLDYRTTFYIYDIAPFVTWTYGRTTDETFAEGKNYYVLEDDEYTLAEVTAGDTVPTAYFEHSYILTTDTDFVDGKAYYTENNGVYTAATVTAGDPVPVDTYYEDDYQLTTDAAFVDGKTYYTLENNIYTAATVTAGDPVPVVYYVHTKVTFSGMTRNITYQFDEIVDCASEFILPEIEDDGYGAWFEIRLRHSGSFSSTLVPIDDTVKIATEHTQAETAGFNMIDLHYMCIDGVKIWRFMNTHSSIPAPAAS